MLSNLNYHHVAANDSEMLHDSAFDVSNMEESLLTGPPGGPPNATNNDSAFNDLFDSDQYNAMDNQLSPQGFDNSHSNFSLGKWTFFLVRLSVVIIRR